MAETVAYLDYNATAPARPEVIAAMGSLLALGGNASSVHQLGRAARREVERARGLVAALVGARSEDMVFTSGGTEANNLALKGVGRRRLFVSAVEHGSLLATALVTDGDAVVLPVDGDGAVVLGRLEEALAADPGPKLVSVMLANNETGVVQPVARIAEMAHAHGALVHTDAVQAAGKIPVDMAELGVDLMSLSAHKLGGPQGVGALAVAEGVPLAAQLVGGGQERGRRAGTENVAGIVGFGVAAELALRELSDGRPFAAMRDSLERRLRDIAPAMTCFGGGVARLPNTTCCTMPGVSSETQVMALDLDGIAVSAGAACSSGKVARSHVLEAMGVADEEAECAIRVSLGWRTESGDIDRLVDGWSRLYRRVHQEARAMVVEPAA